jgi:hypothetical protein
MSQEEFLGIAAVVVITLVAMAYMHASNNEGQEAQHPSCAAAPLLQPHCRPILGPLSRSCAGQQGSDSSILGRITSAIKVPSQPYPSLFHWI